VRKLEVNVERWPLRKAFSTSSLTASSVSLVTVRLQERGHVGRGEAAGVFYRGETSDSIVGQIRDVRADLESGVLCRESLQRRLPPGGARNALDCALWELEARLAGRSVADLLGASPRSLVTLATLSLGSPEVMAQDATEYRDFRVLKLKLGKDDPVARVRAVRSVRPDATLIADANAAWSPTEFHQFVEPLAAAGLEMVEQPCAPMDDARLLRARYPLQVCADESCQDRADLAQVAEHFDMVNIKLDKAGGLTEAVELVHQARAAGLGLVVGNMLGTSLAMAPASLLGGYCRYVDLDGPLLLARDRAPGLNMQGDLIPPLVPTVWG
jgi:L-Ala-D/L-Glu epimerase